MNITLINDTYNWYHWGCNATSLAISRTLIKNKHLLSYVSIQDIYNLNSVPNNINQFKNQQIFENHKNIWNKLIFDKLNNADLILVNGEGTLHGISKQVVGLLYILYVSKKFLNKKVHLINHSAYPIKGFDKNTDAIAKDLYYLTYKSFDFVGIREPISLEGMKKIGIKAELTFDCLPISAEQYLKRFSKKTLRDTIVLAGGVNFNKACLKAIVNELEKYKLQGIKILILVGAKANPAQDDENFINMLNQYKEKLGYDIFYAKNLDEWFECIQNAKILISGRFHYSIAAYCLSTPFLMFESNTPKNYALSKILKVKKPIKYSGSEYEFQSKIKIYINEAIEQDNRNITNDIKDLIKLAEKNFAEIKQ